MSYQNFEKAMSLAPKCKFYTTVGGKSQEEILRSEEMLGIKFSKQCLEFYEKFGYLSFFGTEIFGIDPEDDSGILEGNSVAYTLNDREEYNLPFNWIPVYNYEDGNMAYLDFSNKNAEGEPRIIMCMYTGKEYEIMEVIAEDFGDFLLSLVEQQLDA
ncbi:SMI1/KNR4 family protein [Listeria sp. ILCC797]|uniref:SMI1/KNR4 family protein n=1 Tax=Listeria sp. ILCC797 TaxID=1918333 RepID=UPI000B597C18|nr:SMI1/KNR4 family protein [Listeria sp. ILCC797]